MLKDEATIDEVAIPVQGGTFYLLPAGTPIQDTSRLLQSPKFGQLISQLRQLYDLIIIDSPPVLPVPDALILGRWADGAVIAARYDISRFPSGRASPTSTRQRGNRRSGNRDQRHATLRFVLWTLHLQQATI